MSFTRKKITLPSTAGETTEVQLKGMGVIIEKCNLYDDAENVPVFYFGSANNEEQPIYPQSKYLAEERFERLIFEATTGSTDDEIYVLVSKQCIDQDINISLNLSGNKTTFKNQFSVASTDTAQSLSLLQISNSDGKLPSKMYVCARSQDIAYAIGSNPDQTDEGKILKAGGQWDLISGSELNKSFNFISAVNGSAGNLIVLPIYN